MVRSLVTFFLAIVASGFGQTARLTRQDFFVPEEGGIRIFIREVTAANAPKTARGVLLIHGARVPGIGSFDLDVPGGSLAGDLAERGFAVYVMDVRGYGGSARPTEMDEPPAGRAALVRSNDAARDIGTVVDWVCSRRGMAKVTLFGWATGGQWAGYYASVFPEKVDALILLNSMYGGSTVHPLMGHGSDLEDPQHPGQFNREACGAYRFNDPQSLFGVWDRSIPVANKDEWRDPAVARAYAAAALVSDPTSSTAHRPASGHRVERLRIVSTSRRVGTCGMRP